MIRVAVLGATGSIGGSTLEVIGRHSERFRAEILATHRSVDRLARQVERYRPRVAVVADATQPLAIATSSAEAAEATEWRTGRDALLAAAEDPSVDVVLNALVGAAGLELTVRALAAGKRLALANKESLVAGGPIVLDAARKGGGEIVPIDSEHSAILQCLHGCDAKSVQRLILTASGGPFRGRGPGELRRVRPADALKHPTWAMGAKITIDSATLANKALEVIEAHFLYGLEYDRIGAVVHPQSVIHSFVEFVDGSVLAQVGLPTMELPILYALSYPERIPDATLRTYDPVASSPLTFEEVDHEAFPLFALGVEAGRRGGSAAAVYNAANEVAVEAFLAEKISFPEMADVVGTTLERLGAHDLTDIHDVLAADREARAAAAEVVEHLGRSATGMTRT